MNTNQIAADGEPRLLIGQAAMKRSQIVHGGFWRLFRGQKRLSSESLEEKYATELAKAGPDGKKAIYQRMLEEQAWREKMMNHKPSAKALW